MQEKLQKDFPILFRGRMISCDYPPAWEAIIYDLCNDLEAVLREKEKVSKEPGKLPYAIQVKEKFGGLRFYLEWPDSTIMLNEQEAMSQRVYEAESQVYELETKNETVP